MLYKASDEPRRQNKITTPNLLLLKSDLTYGKTVPVKKKISQTDPQWIEKSMEFFSDYGIFGGVIAMILLFAGIRYCLN